MDAVIKNRRRSIMKEQWLLLMLQLHCNIFGHQCDEYFQPMLKYGWQRECEEGELEIKKTMPGATMVCYHVYPESNFYQSNVQPTSEEK